MSNLSELELQKIEGEIKAIDPTPWRAEFDQNDFLVIWFHANLQNNPKRIVVSFDDEPSKNERAAAAFLVHSREYCTGLIAEVRRLREEVEKKAA